MLQTATIVSDGHPYTTLTIKKYTRNTNTISSANEKVLQRLVALLGRVEFINLLQYTIIPANKLQIKDRLLLQFGLKAHYSSAYVLLKSFFEFGKLDGIKISSDRISKTFTLEILPARSETAGAYLEKVIGWFSSEIKFKTALKRVIAWEREVRNEQQSLADSLMDSIR